MNKDQQIARNHKDIVKLTGIVKKLKANIDELTTDNKSLRSELSSVTVENLQEINQKLDDLKS